MASVAEVRGAEAEEHGHGAAVPALVLQQVGAVLGAHLSAGHVAAPAAHQFRGVVVGAAHVQLASGLATVIGLRDTKGSRHVVLAYFDPADSYKTHYDFRRTFTPRVHPWVPIN